MGTGCGAGAFPPSKSPKDYYVDHALKKEGRHDVITERPYALEHVVRGISFLGCGVCFIANVCSCDSGGAAATDRSPSACCVFNGSIQHPSHEWSRNTNKIHVHVQKDLENCV